VNAADLLADLGHAHDFAGCPLEHFAACAATARALPKAHRRGVWAGRCYDLPMKGKPHDHDPRPARHSRAAHQASTQHT